MHNISARTRLVALMLLAGMWTAGPTRGETFNVTNYGARADGKTDSTLGFQRAVAAAAASAKKMAGMPGGAVVYVPAGPQPYLVTSPVFVDASYVEVRGDGQGSVVQAHTGTPIFVFGKHAGEKPYDRRFRPDAHGTLDRAAAPQAGTKFGISTRGDASLIIPSHPMMLGGLYNRPDYWQKTTKLTVEFFLERPSGVKWKSFANLLGMTGEVRYGQPWSVTASETGKDLAFHWRTSEAPNDLLFRTLIIPLGTATRRWRVTVQIDCDEGRYAVWLNGTRVEPEFRDQPQYRFRKGLSLAEHDGFTPFLIGSGGRIAPTVDAPTTDLTLYGLRIARGLVYQMNQPREVFLDDPARAVDDQSRYFWNLAQVPNAQLVGLLALDDPPPGRTVKLRTEGPDAFGFWVARGASDLAAGCSLRDIQLRGRLQPPVLLGSVLQFVAEDVIARDAMQGIGCINLGASWTLSFNRCFLSGFDAAYYGYQQTIIARDTNILNGGRESVRLVGCNSNWDQTFVAFISEYAQRGFHFLGGEYGGIHRLVGLTYDNESRDFQPGGALIEIEQPNYNSPATLTLESTYAAKGGKDVALVRCTSVKVGEGRARCFLDVRGSFVVNSDDYRAALELRGPAWVGEFDARLLGNSKVIGNDAGLVNVKK